MRKLLLALALCVALIVPASAQLTMTGVGGGSGTAAFTPASLSPNWWFEARSSSLFQSKDGSTAATANSDPVGFASDLSGNSFTITSVADDTTRPTLQGVGSFKYLSCDGSNDMLRRTAGLDGWNAGSTTWVFAFRSNSAGGNTYLAGAGNSSSSNTIFSLIKTQSGTPSSNGGFYRDDSGATPTNAPNGSTPDNSNVHDGNDHVLIAVDTGTAINVWIDGVSRTGIASYTHSGTFTLDRFSICALLRNSPTGGLFWAGRIYGGMIKNGYAASGADITNLTTYFTALYQ